MTAIEGAAASHSAQKHGWRFGVGVTFLVLVLVPIGLVAQALTAHWVAVSLGPTHHDAIEAGGSQTEDGPSASPTPTVHARRDARPT